MPTYDLLHRTSLGSSQAQINITSIPNTYRDLELYISGANTTGFRAGFWLRFNSDSGANYYPMYLANYDGSSLAARNTSATTEILAILETLDSSTLIYSGTKVYIPNYTVSASKVVGAQASSGINVGVNQFSTGVITAIWANNATISSIQINSNTGSFAANTTATLYGISNA